VAMIEFDEEKSRLVEAVYATPDVVAQRRAVLESLALRPGERVLDVGSGPGFLAAEMAAAVGESGAVCGIDISDDMLALAKSRVAAPDAAAMEFRPGSATEIPYPDGSFDVAVSTQVLEYVPDIPGALAELRRVLRPGGRVLLLDTDWDSIVWHSGDPERMRRVLAAFDEHLADPYLPRTLWASLRAAGFAVTATTTVPMLNVGYAEATFSAGILRLVADFVTARGTVPAAEVEAWAADLRGLGPDYFFSLNRYLFSATSPA
jgi:arsenite methyltransferase